MTTGTRAITCLQHLIGGGACTVVPCGFPLEWESGPGGESDALMGGGRVSRRVGDLGFLLSPITMAD